MKQDFKQASKPSSLVYGKVQPQAVELEEAVLGAILLEKDKLAEVLEIVPMPEVFYTDANQRIYAAVQQVSTSGRPVDLLTVTEELRRNGELEGVGGAYYLTRLTMSVVSSAHVEAHARLLYEKWMMREMIRMCGQVIGDAYEDVQDAFELAETLATDANRLSLSIAGGGMVNATIAAKQAMDAIQDARNRPEGLTGIDTGLELLNKITLGWQKTWQVVIAARPAQGKTALALSVALAAAFHGVGVYFHSLEMSIPELTQRCLASMSGVALNDIKSGQLSVEDEQALHAAAGRFSRLPIHFNDRTEISMQGIYANARRQKRKVMAGGAVLSMVIVDYLQLCEPSPHMKKAIREQQVADMSRTGKKMAKDLDLVTVLLSQMNREIDKQNRPPVLADLRESGSIEQDADMVIFPYHEVDANTNKTRNTVRVAKHRHGQLPSDALEVLFLKGIQKWTDMNDPFADSYEAFNPMAGISNRPFVPPADYFDDDKF